MFGDDFRTQSNTVVEKSIYFGRRDDDDISANGLIYANNMIIGANNVKFNCSDMFSGCINLRSAPKLPATKIRNVLYGYMFKGCTSLVDAPALPATTLE